MSMKRTHMKCPHVCPCIDSRGGWWLEVLAGAALRAPTIIHDRGHLVYGGKNFDLSGGLLRRVWRKRARRNKSLGCVGSQDGFISMCKLALVGAESFFIGFLWNCVSRMRK